MKYKYKRKYKSKGISASSQASAIKSTGARAGMLAGVLFCRLKICFYQGRSFLMFILPSFLVFLCTSASAVTQVPIAPKCPSTPAGYWLTYDTHDGVTPNGIMKMRLRRGVLSGALVKVINKPGVKKIARCTKCSGQDHNRVLDGMTLVTGMRYKHGTYEHGHIFDPRTATAYKGYIRMATKPCRLLVRGYIGFSLLGKTVYWTPLTSRQAKKIIKYKIG